IKAPVTAVWAIVKISGKEWQWSCAVALAVCFLLVVIIAVMTTVTPKFKEMQRRTDNLNRVTRENLTGIRVIRAYNAEAYHEKKFEKANTEFTKTQLFTGRMMAILSPVMTGVMNGISLAIYWIGAALINRATPQTAPGLFGDMVVFMSYGMQIISAFMMLAMMFMLAPRAMVSVKRINEVLDTDVTIKDGNGVGQTLEKGSVEFRGVSFRYPDSEEYVLKDVSFSAHPGQTVAFIGATGCGKSTVVNLVSRYYDATRGTVLVDGHDIREYKKDELAAKIGVVSQKALLFSGDIRENVNFGDNNADDDVLTQAVAVAQGSDFVFGEKGGLSARVAQGGSNFSGGQKQRLSIARAVAREPEILIFDDSFSALDFKTDKALRAALKEKLRGSTRLIVAQRIGTIMDADRIIVLDNGCVVGDGTHRQLLETCETYREIAESQLSEEELKHA
ncbi:MAG: ABC transporter ATP-binding protein, partial [Clostridia bacterium]|nr:ABC transporter ATP-binding protein [Clostridia bacterium]